MSAFIDNPFDQNVQRFLREEAEIAQHEIEAENSESSEPTEPMPAPAAAPTVQGSVSMLPNGMFVSAVGAF